MRYLNSKAISFGMVALLWGAQSFFALDPAAKADSDDERSSILTFGKPPLLYEHDEKKPPTTPTDTSLETHALACAKSETAKQAAASLAADGPFQNLVAALEEYRNELCRAKSHQDISSDAAKFCFQRCLDLLKDGEDRCLRFCVTYHANETALYKNAHDAINAERDLSLCEKAKTNAGGPDDKQSAADQAKSVLGVLNFAYGTSTAPQANNESLIRHRFCLGSPEQRAAMNQAALLDVVPYRLGHSLNLGKATRNPIRDELINLHRSLCKDSSKSTADIASELSRSCSENAQKAVSHDKEPAAYYCRIYDAIIRASIADPWPDRAPLVTQCKSELQTLIANHPGTSDSTRPPTSQLPSSGGATDTPAQTGEAKAGNLK